MASFRTAVAIGGHCKYCVRHCRVVGLVLYTELALHSLLKRNDERWVYEVKRQRTSSICERPHVISETIALLQ